MTAETAATTASTDAEISFKVKTSGDSNHSITMHEAATVLDLKNKLAGDDYEKVPADRQRLIYSGRVMKNEEPLSTYKIKAGNTIHMVKSAQSNAAQPAATGAPAAAAVPTNMAAGTANNPLAGLTGARYAGHMGLPGMDMFGADGGMGAPPDEEAIAAMLENPNMQQTLNEALNNPQMIDMMIQNTPALRNNPQARQMLASPEFRRMMTDPQALRQAAQLRRAFGGGAGGAGSFPAPGVTDTTEGAQTGSNAAGSQEQFNPFTGLGAGGAGAGAGNPFAQLFGGGIPGQPPAAAGAANADAVNAQNQFASLFGGAGGDGAANPFLQGMPPMTPERMQQLTELLRNGSMNDLLGGGGLGAFGQAGTPPPPADIRPPEERYADQLRQLNDMGFFDFDRNVEALRRSGGSVQGAIEQLLS
jgi:ubiquilin